MQKKLTVLFALTLLFQANAQVAKDDAKELAASRAQLGDAAKKSAGAVKEHLMRQDKAPDSSVYNALKVAAAVRESKRNPDHFVFYSLPAMSDAMRLTHTYPEDGRIFTPVRIVSAQDEYEPASFTIYPLRNLGKVQLSVSSLKSKDGKQIPASQLDLKVVKIWYQNRNGWISYFVDTGLKLVPELLLNDEDLIRVDTENTANYARVGSPENPQYRWISSPKKLDSSYDEHWVPAYTFKPMKEEFQDAPSLRPVTLNEGEFKQFFLTAHVPKGTAPGIYSGEITLRDKADKQLGTIPVQLKVLDFALPSPKTAFDLNRDYLVTMYNYVSPDIITNENGGDRKLAEEQLLAIFRNMRRHNKTTLMMRGDIGRDMATTIRLLRDAGMSLNPMIGGHLRAGADTPRGLLETEQRAEERKEFYTKHAGHHNIFLGSGDEPPASWVVKMRPHWEIYHKKGFRFFTAGSDVLFNKGGYLYDMCPLAGFPEEGEKKTGQWNDVGNAYTGWYASQHVGVENPAYSRKQNGLVPYLANYSIMINYAFSISPWNDLAKDTYKPMVFAYATRNGLVDTLAWEAFREGIDDIRYATLLKQLAKEAAADKNNLPRVYAGRKALKYLTELNAVDSNLDTVRAEMIRHIQILRAMEGK